AGGDEPEQQLGAGVVQRREPDLVDDDEIMSEQGVDDAADGVVGHATVELFDEFGGGQVAHLVPGGDGGVAERDEQVALAGAGGPDQTKIVGLGDPFEAGGGGEGGVGRRRRGGPETPP